MGGYKYFGDGIAATEVRLKTNDYLDIKINAIIYGPVSSFHGSVCKLLAKIIPEMRLFQTGLKKISLFWMLIVMEPIIFWGLSNANWVEAFLPPLVYDYFSA